MIEKGSDHHVRGRFAERIHAAAAAEAPSIGHGIIDWVIEQRQASLEHLTILQARDRLRPNQKRDRIEVLNQLAAIILTYDKPTSEDLGWLTGLGRSNIIHFVGYLTENDLIRSVGPKDSDSEVTYYYYAPTQHLLLGAEEPELYPELAAKIEEYKTRLDMESASDNS